MFERRLYFHVDWLLLAAVLVITGIGLTMITARPTSGFRMAPDFRVASS